MTSQELIDFETEIGDCFRNKMILAPIHLYHGNEEIILDIFKKVKEKDWVFCSWRSHYQCLLKGVPREQLKKDIINGRSISLCYPEYNIFSSAIVAGVIPIANGMALDLKRRRDEGHVWCFVGDMTSESGCFSENYKYSIQHDLPITWVIEDNGQSVCTDTKKTWNLTESTYGGDLSPTHKIIYYKYESIYPHAGPGGNRITF
jgi:TPP-dependent pyruvate/acetoin dehydrogenase alpha subunit